MGAMDIKCRRIWLDFDSGKIVFEYARQDPTRVAVKDKDDLYRLLKAHYKNK